MEAVPRLPMISFELLTSQEKPQFAPRLKQYISSFYQEDPESYNIEIHNLESLRASAAWPSIDINSCQLMKKYYCQLHFLKSRFPMEENQVASVYFAWKDDYAKMSCSIPDVNFELMCVLLNIGAIHSKLGAEDARSSPEGMKMSCTHFQCAAWAFQTVRESFAPWIAFIMVSPEQVRGMQLVCLAQAQECILEKSLLDNRKATIIAKIAVQLGSYYTQALQAFQSGDDGLVVEHLPNCKYIVQYLQFKIAYHRCIALLYQGQQAEEQQKMGERVAFYQSALESLEEARKHAGKMSSSNQAPFKDTLTFTLDVVEGKRKAATNENEFIYHEDVPGLDSLQEIKGASLVKGIPFNIHDTEVSGPDIFGRLVPMEAHEASSLYSERKAQLLRDVSSRIEKRNDELQEFTTSLQLDLFSQIRNAKGLTQDLVDKAAAMVARPNATKDLIEAMGKLSNSYQEVEAMLKDIHELLREEEQAELAYQETMGKRPPSIIATDLSREAAKYSEAHGKASESNQNLHKAMTTHVANLKILAQPLNQLRQHIPAIQLPDPNVDEETMSHLETLIGKIDQMRTQRHNLWTQLRDAVHVDDITGVLVTRENEQSVDDVFRNELKKHDETISLLEKNMSAQDNICKAMVETYAKFTPSRKYLQDVLHKRNATISALIASHDTYDDLLGKANKGIEFYTKLETNVSKLLQRIKSACKVQQEEREQILAKNGQLKAPEPVVTPATPALEISNNKPKLKDYLDSMKEKKVEPAVIGPQMQYPTSSMYQSQEYVPSMTSYASYSPQYNSAVDSSNYGSYGYTQVNYSDKGLSDRLAALKVSPYDRVNSEAYNYPICSTPATYSAVGTTTNLHTAVSPQVNPSNYSNPPSSYQTVSSTNYPYISASEQYVNGTSENPTNYNYGYGQYYADGTGYQYNYHAAQTGQTGQYSGANTQNSYATSNSGSTAQYTPSTYVVGGNDGYAPTSNSGPNQYGTGQYGSAYAGTSNGTASQYTPQNQTTPYVVGSSNAYGATSNGGTSQTGAGNAYSATATTQYQTPQYPAGVSNTYSAANNGEINQTGQYVVGASSTFAPTSNGGTIQYTNNQYTSNTVDGNYQLQYPAGSNQYMVSQPGIVSTTATPYTYTNTYTTLAPTTYAASNSQYTESVYNQYNQYSAYGQYPAAGTYNGSNVYNQQQQYYQYPQQAVQPQPQPQQQQQSVKKESSIDLLAGLDFSISQAPLIPQKEPVKPDPKPDPKPEQQPPPLAAAPAKKPDSPQPTPKKTFKHVKRGEPFRNPDIVRQFLVEIDRFEKYVESLNAKTLSGPSTLELKWKEVLDAQENVDPSRKSISVARCYPTKNRSPDILPYDYTRVELTTLRDDYINASHVRDVSPYCMDFIVTQAPTAGTIGEFWTMVWEQQIETVVCLLSNSEYKEDPYWPSEVGKELNVQTKTVTVLSCTEKEFWTERKINYAHPELKESRIVTVLQYTAWPGSLFPTNPLPFVDFALRAIAAYEQQKCSGDPVLVHCMSGVGRSGICCTLLAALMELAAIGCPLPDVPSLACKMSRARKNVLRDREHLKFVYVALLGYAQTLKREFTKSDTDKAEENAVPLEKAPIDPLSTLDPLWATRKS